MRWNDLKNEMRANNPTAKALQTAEHSIGTKFTVGNDKGRVSRSDFNNLLQSCCTFSQR